MLNKFETSTLYWTKNHTVDYYHYLNYLEIILQERRCVSPERHISFLKSDMTSIDMLNGSLKLLLAPRIDNSAQM